MNGGARPIILRKYVLVITVAIILLGAAIMVPQWLYLGGEAPVLVVNDSSRSILVIVSGNSTLVEPSKSQLVTSGEINSMGGGGKTVDILDANTKRRLLVLTLKPEPLWPGNRLVITVRIEK